MAAEEKGGWFGNSRSHRYVVYRPESGQITESHGYHRGGRIHRNPTSTAAPSESENGLYSCDLLRADGKLAHKQMANATTSVFLHESDSAPGVCLRIIGKRFNRDALAFRSAGIMDNLSPVRQRYSRFEGADIRIAVF